MLQEWLEWWMMLELKGVLRVSDAEMAVGVLSWPEVDTYFGPLHCVSESSVCENMNYAQYSPSPSCSSKLAFVVHVLLGPSS